METVQSVVHLDHGGIPQQSSMSYAQRPAPLHRPSPQPTEGFTYKPQRPANAPQAPSPHSPAGPAGFQSPQTGAQGAPGPGSLRTSSAPVHAPVPVSLATSQQQGMPAREAPTMRLHPSMPPFGAYRETAFRSVPVHALPDPNTSAERVSAVRVPGPPPASGPSPAPGGDAVASNSAPDRRAPRDARDDRSRLPHQEMYHLVNGVFYPNVTAVQTSPPRRISLLHPSQRNEQCQQPMLNPRNQLSNAPPAPGIYTTSGLALDPGPPFKKIRLADQRQEPHGVERPLRIDVRDNVYIPQVEAISPTLPNDTTVQDDFYRVTKDDLLSQIHKMDREISKYECEMKDLKKKEHELMMAANNHGKFSILKKDEEEIATPKHQSSAQKIYAENRKRAQEAHASLDKLGPEVDYPLYNQPSDTSVYYENKRKYLTFKETLMEHLKRKHAESEARDKYLANLYSRLMQEWLRKVERMEVSQKRKAKEARNREFFEKVFPELRKAREDKERFNRVGARIKSEADMEEIMDGLQEQEMEDKKMRSMAVVPPILLDSAQRRLSFQNDNGRLEDFTSEYKERQLLNVWTSNEKEIFRDKYLQHPKNFGIIASYLDRKSVSDCVQHYYLSKKMENYKQLLRKSRQRTRSSRNNAHGKPGANNANSTGLVDILSSATGVTTRLQREQLQQKQGDPQQRQDQPQTKQEHKQQDLGQRGARDPEQVADSPKPPLCSSPNTVANCIGNTTAPSGVAGSLLLNDTASQDIKKGEGKLENKKKERRKEEKKKKESEQMLSSDEDVSEQDKPVGTQPCIICKQQVDGASQSRLLQRQHAAQYGLKEEEVPAGARVCNPCRCKAVRSRHLHCPLPSCPNAKGRVKRVRQFPPKWLELPAEQRKAISEEFQIPYYVNRACSTCFSRIARRINPTEEVSGDASPGGVNSLRWTDEETELLRRALREHGTNWAKVSEALQGSKTHHQCKNYYFNYRKKIGLDALVQEYNKNHLGEERKPALTDEEESGSSTSSCDEVPPATGPIDSDTASAASPSAAGKVASGTPGPIVDGSTESDAKAGDPNASTSSPLTAATAPLSVVSATSGLTAGPTGGIVTSIAPGITPGIISGIAPGIVPGVVTSITSGIASGMVPGAPGTGAHPATNGTQCSTTTGVQTASQGGQGRTTSESSDQRPQVKEDYDSSATETADEGQGGADAPTPSNSQANGPSSPLTVKDLMLGVIEMSLMKNQQISTPGDLPASAPPTISSILNMEHGCVTRDYRSTQPTEKVVTNSQDGNAHADLPKEGLVLQVQKAQQIQAQQVMREQQPEDLSVKRPRDSAAPYPGRNPSPGGAMHMHVAAHPPPPAHSKGPMSQNLHPTPQQPALLTVYRSGEPAYYHSEQGSPLAKSPSLYVTSVAQPPTPHLVMSSRPLPQQPPKQQPITQVPPSQQCKLSPAPKGSITQGTPVSSPQQRHEGLLRQIPSQGKEAGSITLGTPVMPARTLPYKLYATDYMKSNPPVTTSAGGFTSPYLHQHQSARPAPYTMEQQLCSRQIIMTDYITSQQMPGTRRPEKPGEAPRGSPLYYAAPGTPTGAPPPGPSPGVSPGPQSQPPSQPSPQQQSQQQSQQLLYIKRATPQPSIPAQRAPPERVVPERTPPERTPPPQARQGVIQRHNTTPQPQPLPTPQQRPLHFSHAHAPPPPPGHEAFSSLVDVAVQQPSLPVPQRQHHEGLGKTMADSLRERDHHTPPGQPSRIPDHQQHEIHRQQIQMMQQRQQQQQQRPLPQPIHQIQAHPPQSASTQQSQQQVQRHIAYQRATEMDREAARAQDSRSSPHHPHVASPAPQLPTTQSPQAPQAPSPALRDSGAAGRPPTSLGDTGPGGPAGPGPGRPSSESGDSTFTAASVIDAIITHTINEGVPAGPNAGQQGPQRLGDRLFKDFKCESAKADCLRLLRMGPVPSRRIPESKQSPSHLVATAPPTSSSSAQPGPPKNKTLSEHIDSIITKDLNSGNSVVGYQHGSQYPYDLPSGQSGVPGAGGEQNAEEVPNYLKLRRALQQKEMEAAAAREREKTPDGTSSGPQDERQIIRIAQPSSPRKAHVEPVSPPDPASATPTSVSASSATPGAGHHWLPGGPAPPPVSVAAGVAAADPMAFLHQRRYYSDKNQISPLDYVKNRIVEVMRTSEDDKGETRKEDGEGKTEGRSGSPGEMVIDDSQMSEEKPPSATSAPPAPTSASAPPFVQTATTFAYPFSALSVPQAAVAPSAGAPAALPPGLLPPSLPKERETVAEPKPLLSSQYEALSDED